jgi:peptidoglycan hydrolase CwlO-like protein
MKEETLRTSWKSIPSLILKGFIFLSAFWLLTVLVYIIFRIIFGYRELVSGMTNSFLFAVLALLSYLSAGIMLLIIGKITQISNEVKIKNDSIEAKKGFLFPKSYLLKNEDIKSARLIYYPFQFVDDLFGLKGVIIEGKNVSIAIDGIENAEEIVNIINERIKKLDVDKLLKEISTLKEKINEYEEKIKKLEGELDKLRKKKTEEEKKKFEIGPLEEKM